MISEKEYLYWLSHVPLLGAVKIKKLWEKFGTFQAVYNIEESHIAGQSILSKAELQSLISYKKNIDLYRAEYHSLQEKRIQFITPLDACYPERLKPVYGCPMGLYIKGTLPTETQPTAAIIGARNCSHYGKEIAEWMGEELSKLGIQIISGLASGIDGAGHRGALKANQPTFGVLGSGINICYPKEHYSLYEAMIKQGGIITECVLGESPQRKHFPMRNRIISGLSDVILVIEAKEKSGSLITVGQGLEQGKEIFALPGRITDPLSKGCNSLIAEGANILLGPEDVIEFFGLNSAKILRVHEKKQNGLAKNEKMVYSCLDLQPKFLEEIIDESGLSINECMSILLDLELSGYIVETASHYYAKKL